ncbi:MAG TPA: sigma-70 family RNA polymerase sigma factor [Bacteroidia bacterium]|nr:sigma-70 family RNA polymerase sigma factor [Bacteroidia bacterium]
MVTLELLKQCTKNNRRAHFELYKASFACLYKVCKRYYLNDDDVKSALNMSFLKVITHLDQFLKKEKYIETFEFWMTRIAINHIIDEFRQNQKYKAAMQHTEDFSMIKTHQHDNFELNNDSPEIMNAIEKLPLATRTVFTMYTIDGYKHKEIAALMQISENTSKAHFYQAKMKLRELLNLKDKTQLAISIILFIIYFK